MKSLLIIAISLFYSFNIFACDWTLPKTFFVKEKIFEFLNNFVVEDEHRNQLGEIEEEFFTWGRTFTLYDNNRNIIARAKARVFTFEVIIDVEDCHGRRIGTIREEIFENLFSWENTYSILNHQGVRVATSRKLDWLETNIRVLNPSMTTELVHLRRPSFLDHPINYYRDIWRIEYMSTPNDVDPRLVVFLAAYKTAADEDRSAREEDEESAREEEEARSRRNNENRSGRN